MPDSFSPNDNGYEYTIEDGGITTTVYFDDTFEIIGEAISDPDTGVSFSEVITEDAVAGTYTFQAQITHRRLTNHTPIPIIQRTIV